MASIVLLGNVRSRWTYAGNVSLQDLSALFSALKRRGRKIPAGALSAATLLAAVYGI